VNTPVASTRKGYAAGVIVFLGDPSERAVPVHACGQGPFRMCDGPWPHGHPCPTIPHHKILSRIESHARLNITNMDMTEPRAIRAVIINPQIPRHGIHDT